MKLCHLLFAFLAVAAFVPAASGQCFTSCATGHACDAYDTPRSWCGCPCLRDWEFYADALALSRVYNDTPIVPLGLLNSQEFDGDFAAGFEVGARNDCWELRYFQVDSFSSTVDLFGPGTFLNGAFSDLATFTYDTQLYSGELNRYFRDRSHPVRAFVGLRYLQLNEQLDFRLLGIPANALTTSNHLYGGQLGLEAFLWNSCDGRFYVDSFAKAGVYYAATGNDNDAIILGSLRQSASSDGAAFVGELQLMAGWHVTRRLTLETGYQLMWLDGVALAGEQATTLSPFSPTFASINHGDVLFHGFKLGATFTW